MAKQQKTIEELERDEVRQDTPYSVPLRDQIIFYVLLLGGSLLILYVGRSVFDRPGLTLLGNFVYLALGYLLYGSRWLHWPGIAAKWKAWEAYKKDWTPDAQKDWNRWKAGTLDYAPFLEEQFGEQGDFSRQNPQVVKIRRERLWKNEAQFVDYILGDWTIEWGKKGFTYSHGETHEWQFNDARMFRYRRRASDRKEVRKVKDSPVSEAEVAIREVVARVEVLQERRDWIPKIAKRYSVSEQEVEEIFEQVEWEKKTANS